MIKKRLIPLLLVVLLFIPGTALAADSADLAITVTDSPDPVLAGSYITYTITVVNNGPNDAANAMLSAPVPANTTWLGASVISQTAGPLFVITVPPGGTSTVTGTTSNLPSGASATISLTAHVLSGTAPSTISFTPSIASGTADPDGTNNSSTASTTVNTSADLSVSMTDSPDPVTAGSNLTYTITATNAGPSDASGAEVSMVLPAGTTFVSLSAPGGWTSSMPAFGGTGNVTASRSSFGAAGSAVFTLVCKTDPSLAAGSTVAHTATISATTSDPAAGNNSSTATTNVTNSADLSVSVTDSPDPVTAGNNITYTVTATNAGPSNASGAAVSAALPAGTTFVSLSPPAGWSATTPAVGGTGTVTASRSSFAPGSAVFTLVCKVNSSVPAGTVLTLASTISATTADPASGNNSASTSTTVSPATILNVSPPADGIYGTGSVLSFTVNFSGPVTLDTSGGMPSLGLDFDGRTAAAPYVSGSGTSALVFRYTIAEGDAASGLVYGSIHPVALNGGSFTGTVDLTLPASGPAMSIKVDGIRPVVTAQKSGGNIALSFSEPVTAGSASIQISDGTNLYSALAQAGTLSPDGKSAVFEPGDFTGFSWRNDVTYTLSVQADAFRDSAANGNLFYQGAGFIAGHTVPVIGGLSDSYRIFSGGRLILSPTPAGGTWTYDPAYLSLKGNTFTALKIGTTTATYSVPGEAFPMSITIRETVLPRTGQDFSAVYILCTCAAAVFLIMIRNKRKSEKMKP